MALKCTDSCIKLPEQSHFSLLIQDLSPPLTSAQTKTVCSIKKQKWIMRTTHEPVKALRLCLCTIRKHNVFFFCCCCCFCVSSLQCEKSQKLDLTSHTISDRSTVYHCPFALHLQENILAVLTSVDPDFHLSTFSTKI